MASSTPIAAAVANAAFVEVVAAGSGADLIGRSDVLPTMAADCSRAAGKAARRRVGKRPLTRRQRVFDSFLHTVSVGADPVRGAMPDHPRGTGCGTCTAHQRPQEKKTE